MYRELLLGCGHRRQRFLDPYVFPQTRPIEPPAEDTRWKHVMAVDINPDCKPDYVMDLDHGLRTLQPVRAPDEMLFDLASAPGAGRWLRNNVFDEVHAYEVLEHLGRQGDATTFFSDFDEIWQVLKPGGFLCASVPSRYSHWLWGDPGHRRVILPVTLPFLHRPHYDQYVGTSASSDYRAMFNGDWDIIYTYDNEETHNFVLQAVKPARNPV